MEGLVQCSANYSPLTPVSILERASMVYGDRVSIIYGSLTYTWKETFERCFKLAASVLNQLKVAHGDIVAALGPNTPELYELHFAVPMAGAIVSPLNIYQESTTLAAELKLLEARTDPAAKTASPGYQLSGYRTFDSLLNPTNGYGYEIVRPKGECDPISIVITSGVPKGVVHSHRKGNKLHRC
ncbi:LOW QUALITY PROTEIN: probable acyl-activating enzyme 1, peroxisomal [Herrania umbratica]|uniref:LOW QUALITY PROTEIN: probable acyl-activating enzyme 1, peroxisomal n=1 Tax=Herrania umbratica TaxID=108875 RepID=A0A6J1AHF5_9ROSI|nr:LOW QUALITY PROTEIN: probable acyl-activating enzyme 1, peroxisomal [Herrania umbratica]